jgi:hypothetical protein
MAGILELWQPALAVIIGGLICYLFVTDLFTGGEQPVSAESGIGADSCRSGTGDIQTDTHSSIELECDLHPQPPSPSASCPSGNPPSEDVDDNIAIPSDIGSSGKEPVMASLAIDPQSESDFSSFTSTAITQNETVGELALSISTPPSAIAKGEKIYKIISSVTGYEECLIYVSSMLIVLQ